MNKAEKQMKDRKYAKLLRKNMRLYRDRKVKIPFLEVWVGKVCTLRCKTCIHMIPYIKPQKLDIEELIRNCRIMIKLCDIEYLSIAGGEPFCCKDLYKFLDFVKDEDAITDGKIITNGTLLPDERTRQSIKDLNGKLEIRVDVYPGQEEKCSPMVAFLQEENIRHHIQWYRADKKSNWKFTGSPRQWEIAEKMTKVIYRDCIDKHCFSMCGDEFTSCPRGIVSEEIFHIEKNPYEHIRVSELKDDALSRAKIATCMEDSIYKDFCRYCLGLTESNPYFVVPGEQIERE